MSDVTYTFGNHVVQREARQVLVGGAPAKLGPRAYDVLVALIERRDRVVTKSELLDVVWPGLVVEENNLQVHIWSLRKLLGPQTISTIPGRGYRFTAMLVVDFEAAQDAAVAALPAATEHDDVADRPSALFGRENDLIALPQWLKSNRLVTVVGSGATRTRLKRAANGCTACSVPMAAKYSAAAACIRASGPAALKSDTGSP